MAATLERTQGSALSGNPLGRREPCRQTYLCSGRAGLRRYVAIRAFIPPLARRAERVTLRVHQQLVRLLRESLPGITVLGDRGNPAPYQCDAVLLSLPRLFRTRLESI